MSRSMRSRAGGAAAGLVGLALLALVAGCTAGGKEAASSSGASQAANRAAGSAAPSALAGAGASGGSSAGSEKLQLIDLGNRIVRKATVSLQVGKGTLNDSINRATDIVTRHQGIYVSASTTVPDGGGAASGQVAFKVPVAAFETTLRELKGLGKYRGEDSSSEDVTTQFIDLNAQLASWRAQDQVYLRLLNNAKSISDVISIQTRLQEVQSNIDRLQGQVNYLDDASSFSIITLSLTESGAAPASGRQPGNRLARAWATAVGGLAAMAAAALVAVVWLVPLGLLALVALWLLRVARRRGMLPPAPEPAPAPKSL